MDRGVRVGVDRFEHRGPVDAVVRVGDVEAEHCDAVLLERRSDDVHHVLAPPLHSANWRSETFVCPPPSELMTRLLRRRRRGSCTVIGRRRRSTRSGSPELYPALGMSTSLLARRTAA